MNPIGDIKRTNWYKWVIVAVSFLMVMICLGFCSSTKPLYLSAITGALGIERGLFSINDSCRFITTAVVNLFFGALIAKFGPRKLVAAGFLSLCASMLIYSLAESIYVFYIGGCLLGLGLSWTTTTMVGYVVGIWCKENKGTIMGVVLAANGLGGAIAAQIIGPIISGQADGFGYRTAYRLTALILLVVGVIVVGLFKDAPTDAPSAAVAKKKPKGESWSGISFSQCLKTPYFYIAAVCVFLTGLALQGINGVYKAHMNDVGIPDDYSTMIVSIHSLALVVLKFLTGVIHDKKGLRFTMIMCDIAAIAMAIILALVSPTTTGMVLAMAYGVISALGLPLETIMLPLITADLFGEKDYAKILGILVSFNQFGYAVGAPLTNLVFDLTGTYVPSLYAMAAVMLAVTVVFQFILSAAKRRKQAVALDENAQ